MLAVAALVVVLVSTYWLTRSLWKTLLLVVLFGVAITELAPGEAAKVFYAALQVGFGVQSHRVVVENASWPVLEFGPADGVPVYLQHGFAAEKSSFFEMAVSLSKKGFRCFAADVLGHGENVRPVDGDFLPPAQARRIFALMSTFLGNEPFHVVGNSMGGHIALLMALEHPERILSMTLIANAGVKCPEETPWVKAGGKPHDARTSEGFDEMIRFVTTPDSDLVNKVPRFLKRAFIAKRIEQHDHVQRMIQQYLPYIEENPLNEQLASIGIPTLIVWGKHDQLLHVSCADYEHQRIKGSKKLVLDCGHIPQREMTAAVVDAFIDLAKTK